MVYLSFLTSCRDPHLVHFEENRPFLSFSQFFFQSESKCEIFVMVISFNFSMNETDIHNNNFALGLVLKEKLRRTRKWPIGLCGKEGMKTWR